ncbi:MAG: hypothetical protein QW104_01345 [Nitrososphaerota archaeon]
MRSKENELYCSNCGLIVDYFNPLDPPPIPHQHGSTIHNINKLDYRYLSSQEVIKVKIFCYLNHYLNGQPRSIKMRAENLALKVLRLNVLTGNPEAIAFACAYAAAAEYNIRLDIRALPRSMRRSVRKVLRYLKEMGLYRIQSPRDRVEYRLRQLCARNSFDFEKCRELYYRHEKKLSRLAPSNAANTVCYAYSLMHNLPLHTDWDTSKLRKIAREIVKEEYTRQKNPEEHLY